ncbi:MAG: hydantoinase/oxoprolinase family protein, partial [Dongiales bacterium]
SIDMRYRRQTHDLMVPFPEGPVTAASVRAGVERFQSDYEANYGRGSGFREAGVELSTFRVLETGRPRKPELSWAGASWVPQPA